MSITLGLERLFAVAPRLPYTRPTLHITGTNGKGSVSALLSSILLASGYRVGRFNSPHLVKIHDSITLDGGPVSVEEYERCTRMVEEAKKETGAGLSNFEILTMTALCVFESAKVDIVILEVGLGGRLDATNAVTDECILVSGLTTVDLDHQAFLGDTIEKIAREKAGIARRGKPLVLGEQLYDAVEPVVRDVLQDVGSPLSRPAFVGKQSSLFSPETRIGPFRPPPPQLLLAALPSLQERLSLEFPLQGDHQVANLATALGMIDALRSYYPPYAARITAETITLGVSKVSWPGRLSFHTITHPRPLLVLADGAHNAGSAVTLGKYLSQYVSTSTPGTTVSLILILGLSHSPTKAPLETLLPLLSVPSPPGIAVRLSVAPSSFSIPDAMPWVKPVPPTTIESAVKEIDPSIKIQVTLTISEALDWARKQPNGQADRELVIVAGSLYLVSDFYRLMTTG